MSKIGYEGQPDDERKKEEREDHGLPAQDDKPMTRKKRKVVIDDTDEDEAPPPKKKKGNGRKNAVVIASSEDEDEKVVPAAPKKKVNGPRRPAFKKVEPKKLFGDKAEKAPLKETSGNVLSPPDKGKAKKVAPAPAVKGKKKQVSPAPEVAESSKAQGKAQVAPAKSKFQNPIVVSNKVNQPDAEEIAPKRGDPAKINAAKNALKPAPAPPDKGKGKQVAWALEVGESLKANANAQDSRKKSKFQFSTMLNNKADHSDARETVPSKKGDAVTGSNKEGEVPLPKTPKVPAPQHDGPKTPVTKPKPPTEPKSVEPAPPTEPTPTATSEPKDSKAIETAPAPTEPVQRKKLKFGEYLSRKNKPAEPALVTKEEIEQGVSELSERRRKPYHDGNIPVYDAKILDVPSDIFELSESSTPAKTPVASPALAPVVNNGTPDGNVQTPSKQNDKSAATTTTSVPKTPLQRSSLANEIRADEDEKPQTPKATDDADDKEEGEISDSSSPKLLKRPQKDTHKEASRSSRAPPPLKMSGSENAPVLNYGDETKDTHAAEKPRISQKRSAEEFDEDNVQDDPPPSPKRRKSLSPVRRSSRRAPR